MVCIEFCKKSCAEFSKKFPATSGADIFQKFGGRKFYSFHLKSLPINVKVKGVFQNIKKETRKGVCCWVRRIMSERTAMITPEIAPGVTPEMGAETQRGRNDRRIYNIYIIYISITYTYNIYKYTAWRSVPHSSGSGKWELVYGDERDEIVRDRIGLWRKFYSVSNLIYKIIRGAVKFWQLFYFTLQN